MTALVQKLDVTLMVGARTVEQPKVRAVGPLPPSAYRSIERGIGLHLELIDDRTLKCTAFQAVCSVASLKIKMDVLENKVRQLRNAWFKLVTNTKDNTGRRIFQTRGAIPDWATEQALRELAPLGKDLFQALFLDEPTTPVGRDIGRWLREAQFDASRPRLISITSEEVFLPWALMYVGDLDKPTWDGFLGIRHVVEHLPLSYSEAAVSSTEISREPCG